MTKSPDNAGSTSIAPLRRQKADGTLYSRPIEVEQALAVLSGLPTMEMVERCRIDDTAHPEYVPSECVLYFVRRPTLCGSEDALRELFVILRRRVLLAVPVPARRLAASRKFSENTDALEIRDRVVHKFQELLCRDRREYNERLDYYECRFNSALAKLRLTARRDVQKAASRHRPLPGPDTGEPSKEVEAALAALRGPVEGQGVDFLYRSKLYLAISTLPPDERRVIELLLQELPIESKDESELTIVKVIGCTEKTVRNRRDRAFQKLRDALKEEEE
jgi:DNA-directed RNA polymerase specialized sigma24 family protein